MPAGMYRTCSPDPEECIQLGEELLKWATEQTGEFRFRFPQWYSLKKNILRDDWKALIKTPEFRPYYEKVQSIFADKCLAEYVKEGFGQRYLRLYDRDLVEDENDKAKYLSDLKKEENNSQPQQIVIQVSHDLAAGSNISTPTVPIKNNQSPQ